MNNNFRQNLSLFVLFPILSILIGFFGMKTYIQYNGDPKGLIEISENIDQIRNKDEYDDNEENDLLDSESGNEIITAESFTFKGCSIYGIQVGSFGEYANAERMVEQLNEIGFDGYILKGKMNRVFVEAYLDKANANQRLEFVKKSFSDAYIVSVVCDDVTIDVSGDGKAFRRLRAFSKDVESTFEAMDTKMVSINIDGIDESIKATVENEAKYFQDISEQFKGYQVSDEMEYTFNSLKDCVNRMSLNYGSLANALDGNEEEPRIYWSDVISTYFIYIDFLDSI